MRRFSFRGVRLPVVCASLLVQAILGSEPAVAQDPTTASPAAPTDLAERLAVNVINVDAFVVDKKGRPVTDLKPLQLAISGFPIRKE